MERITTISNPGSSTSRPDLDWSQIKETITMICLATTQIETAIKDSAKSVNDLTHSFTDISKESKIISTIAEELQPCTSDNQKMTELLSSAKHLNKSIESSVISFQFHDRISQKLAHINLGLASLADLIGDPAKLFNPIEWEKIQLEISKSYSLECERMMFEAIMKGATVQEALELYHMNYVDAINDADKEDDIELF